MIPRARPLNTLMFFLQGFLESGPSFCLQTYILLVGHKKGTNIDWDNVKEDDIGKNS